MTTNIPQPLPAPLRTFATVLILAVVGLGGGGSAQAQLATPNPPERMTYQGFLADGNGVALATNAPKNFDVVFRIWNDASATAPANRLWAEQQTVTVDRGYFSVLLGEGLKVSAEAHDPLSTLFASPTASDRFVEMTVKGIGAGGIDVTMLPRLRLMSSPYAFLAQSAAKVVGATGADLITSPAAGVVNIAGTLNATTINAAGLTGLTAAQVPNLDAGKITTGALADARLSANVALRGANTFVGPQVIQATTAAPDASKIPLRIVGAGPFLTFPGPLGGSQFISIQTENHIAAPGYFTTSDSRLKEVAGRSSVTEDLATIQRLSVTDYRMVDTLREGTGLRKGFIAQEVEKVIPGAVTRRADFVPDVYARASAVKWNAANHTLALTLPGTHGLKTGDQVKVYADDSTLELGVVGVPAQDQVVLGHCDKEVGKAFVYGRKVSDFRTVDYDRIFTTGIGAIQELAKRLENVEGRESRLAELERKADRVNALEREVGELKKMVAQLAEAARQSAQPIPAGIKSQQASVAVPAGR